MSKNEVYFKYFIMYLRDFSCKIICFLDDIEMFIYDCIFRFILDSIWIYYVVINLLSLELVNFYIFEVIVMLIEIMNVF